MLRQSTEQRFLIKFAVTATLLIGFVISVFGCATLRSTPSPHLIAESTTFVTATLPTHEWILINLLPGASQLDYGSEVYRLVCRDCHGDHGQGLTDEWRATWAPDDQNCWQSKCHGPNHPPGGFVMPIAPTVVGPVMRSRFTTAQDLHDFIQNAMPWYDPGSLTEKDSWSVTAYLLNMNGIDPGVQLGPETARQISVH